MTGQIGKSRRLSRLFRPSSGRMLCLPLDHGMQVGPIQGLEDPARAIDAALSAGVDALIVNPGMLARYADRLSGGPGLILRIDQTTMWRIGSSTGYPDTHNRIVATVEDAVRFGAEAVITYLFTCNNRPEEESRSVEICGAVATACREWGMVHVIEAMAATGGFVDPADPDIVAFNCRIAAEIGADIVKTTWTGSAASFAPVVKHALAPVVVAGGPAIGDADAIIAYAEEAVSSGARGLMFGRNVFQSPDPRRLLSTLADTVHKTV